jgi:hypothetical protein
MLAGIMTFHQAVALQKKKLSSSTIINIHTDNERLINRIRQRRTHPRTINQQCESDTDIELKLLSEIRSMESIVTKVTIQHVSSHGVNTRRKDLSAIEKLHCIADGLAKQARQLPRQKIYHLFPCNPVTLEVNHCIVTAQHTKITAEAYHSINLRQHLKTKNNWSSQTIDTIWWRVHHQTLTKYSEAEQMTLRKFNCKCWATRKREHKFYDHRPSHCHSCFETVESEDHILRCT